MDVPDVQYARSGPLSIAYQVVGDRQRDLVIVRGGLDDMLSSWERQEFHDLLEELTAFSRVLLFDKRGSGLSDAPQSGIALESRMDDIRAVMDAAASGEAVLLAMGEGARLAMMFAATYPDRTRGLVLLDPAATDRWSPDHPWGMSEADIDARVRDIRERWGTRSALRDWWAGTPDPPGVDSDEIFEWDLRRFRRGASPNAAATFWRAAYDTDVRAILPAVRTATTVIRTWRDPEPVRFVADRIDGARYLEVDTGSVQMWWGYASWRRRILEEVRLRIEGESTVEDTRVLTTLLFTDIVESTRRAVELGDRAWRELVQQHHALVRRELARFRGVEVDTAGDGFFATFDGPARAIRCAWSITDAVAQIGLAVRAGIHTGECEIVDGKVGGLAVNIGARVAALAGAGDVIATSTVKDLVAGSGIAFEDAGEHELKGIPSPWRIYRAVAPTSG